MQVVWTDRRDAVHMVIYSTAGMMAVQYSFFIAVEASNGGTATVLQYTNPGIMEYRQVKNAHRIPVSNPFGVITSVCIFPLNGIEKDFQVWWLFLILVFAGTIYHKFSYVSSFFQDNIRIVVIINTNPTISSFPNCVPRTCDCVAVQKDCGIL